jgi:hypothetical protein
MLMLGEQLLTQMTATTGLRAELLDATVRLLHSRDVAGLTLGPVVSCVTRRSESIRPLWFRNDGDELWRGHSM